MIYYSSLSRLGLVRLEFEGIDNLIDDDEDDNYDVRRLRSRCHCSPDEVEYRRTSSSLASSKSSLKSSSSRTHDKIVIRCGCDRPFVLAVVVVVVRFVIVVVS